MGCASPHDSPREEESNILDLRRFPLRVAVCSPSGAKRRSCRNALRVFTREERPNEWATVQNNLGNALWAQGIRMEGGKAAELLAEAVATYRSALEVRTREKHPQYWSTTQDNLGNALREKGIRA